jgi:NAD(P) transhydrogenase
MYDFDVLVLGSGPGGQKAAIAAAKLDRRVAVIERRNMIGGVCINTGTIPSKTLREAVLYLTGLNQREMYGQSYRVKEDITVGDLGARTQHVIGREIEVIRSQLARNRVRLLQGTGKFVDPHTLALEDDQGRESQVSSDKIIIAAGTRPARPDSVDFNDVTIIDSDGILNLDKVPSSMVVVGAGVIGIEYASMFAALGTKVTVVERRERMLDFCDLEIVEALKYHLRDLSVSFRFRETVAAVERHGRTAVAVLASGKRIAADTVMYSAGRQGAADMLGLEKAGLTADPRGRISVDEHSAPRCRTSTRSGTSSASRRSRRRRWSRAAWRRTTRARNRCAACSSCSRSASTRSRRSASSAELRMTSRTTTSPSRSASRATVSWPAARSSATPTACSR